MDTKEYTIKEAVSTLTGFEINAIERHYGTGFEQLSGVKISQAVLWAFGNRGDKTEWKDVLAMTLGEIESSFQAQGVDPLEQSNDETP